MALLLRMVWLSMLLFPSAGYALPACAPSRELTYPEWLEEPTSVRREARRCHLRQSSKQNRWVQQRGKYVYGGQCILQNRDRLRRPKIFYSHGCQPNGRCAVYIGSNSPPVRLQVDPNNLVCARSPWPFDPPGP